MITSDSKNILLADDSIFFRTKLSTILTEAGHQVTLAEGGEEAIKKLRENPNKIDLLTLDLQMPDIDGIGVLEWINENTYRGMFPVLVITGITDIDKMEGRLKSLGANDLVKKDCPTEQIIYRINHLLFPQKSEERMEERVPLSVPVDFTVGDENHLGFMLNISASGIYLRTRVYLPPVSVLRLKFSLPDSDRVFELKGIVKWSTPSGAAKSLFGGAGVMFMPMADEDKEEILSFVEGECKRLNLEGDTPPPTTPNSGLH